MEKYKLSKFLDSTCIYFENISIKRREVITYICNKLGGVHFDKTRNSKNEIEKKYILFDMLRNKKTLVIGREKNIDCVFFELLSIGQAVINSDDIQKLLKQLKSFFNK